ncbi:MAG: helix-turn-helix domain-containing protein, partial [Bacilli bacterium]|nr:helix-turn-helix domain-containing protein [Bacilli bacterium]
MTYKQLTMKKRYQIEALKKEGLSQRAIALNINVHYSTISRELKRNSLDNDEYNAINATVSAFRANGLIREYFPKKMPFINITDEQIVEVQNRLNNRPRKVLGYKTPAEVFFDTITKSYVADRKSVV